LQPGELTALPKLLARFKGTVLGRRERNSKGKRRIESTKKGKKDIEERKHPVNTFLGQNSHILS